MNGVDLEVAIDQLPHHGELGELSLDSGESGPYIICENQHVFQRLTKNSTIRSFITTFCFLNILRY